MYMISWDNFVRRIKIAILVVGVSFYGIERVITLNNYSVKYRFL